MLRLISALIALSMLLVAPAAYADKRSKSSSHEKHNHYCTKDGERIEAKSRKKCLAAGGTWKKDSSGGSKGGSQSSQ
jgi:hypothetical protein